MQQYDGDNAPDDEVQNSGDGGDAIVAGVDLTREDEENRNAATASTANAANSAIHRSGDSEEDEVEEEEDNYWRRGASRPGSPLMADNASDNSSMMPPQRPKSRVDITTSRSPVRNPVRSPSPEAQFPGVSSSPDSSFAVQYEQ
ncbi:unnamed protein product [Brassicogethes aeneus]|uniref:Uncharacterized protein n=1 Tax=Brassicogethes aeneus TaxID=1431903 RepID=A0A9P0B2I3_BRAAE|nr:unnamed protein product [Brassicogethes aeneus]